MTEKKRRHLTRQKKRKIRRLNTCALMAFVAIVSFLLGKRVGETKVYDTNSRQAAANGAANTSFQNTPIQNTSDHDLGLPEEGGEGYGILLLVNKDNELPKDYEVELMRLPDGTNQAAAAAYQPLCDMLQAGRREGLSFEICSSYRTVERQQELLDEGIAKLTKKGYTYEMAYIEVTRELMPPGYSEHSTGLAFDIVALHYQMLDSGQEKTAESKWLQKHCAEYGFILRYPKEKEDVTDISYESWHYRYVGVEAASYIMEHGITLEEYLSSGVL